MRMPDFIEQNMEPILEEWEQFAETLKPAAAGLDQKELRNFAKGILLSVVDDMRCRQTEAQRHEKSGGSRENSRDASEVKGSAREHAADRLAEGFTLNQLVAEYRALRASVIRRWRHEIEQISDAEVEELTRFNESIDESLTESIGWYNSRLEDARDLLNGVLAHDLRSPLGAILTSAEALLQDEFLDARHTRTALRIRNGGIRMKSMISDLLDFTRTRLGTGLPMSVVECSMEQVVLDVIEEQRAFHPEAAFRCTSSGDLTGQWDEARIQQMLTNLVANAVEHGLEKTTVTVTAEGRDGRVSVSVHNRGGPIPEEEQQVIFDPLRRAVVRNRQERLMGAGLGLGLYIARQIAEAHAGTIGLRSSEETGTTFTATLPRQRKRGAETAGIT